MITSPKDTELPGANPTSDVPFWGPASGKMDLSSEKVAYAASRFKVLWDTFLHPYQTSPGSKCEDCEATYWCDDGDDWAGRSVAESITIHTTGLYQALTSLVAKLKTCSTKGQPYTMSYHEYDAYRLALSNHGYYHSSGKLFEEDLSLFVDAGNARKAKFHIAVENVKTMYNKCGPLNLPEVSEHTAMSMSALTKISAEEQEVIAILTELAKVAQKTMFDPSTNALCKEVLQLTYSGFDGPVIKLSEPKGHLLDLLKRIARNDSHTSSEYEESANKVIGNLNSNIMKMQQDLVLILLCFAAYDDIARASDKVVKDLRMHLDHAHAAVEETRAEWAEKVNSTKKELIETRSVRDEIKKASEEAGKSFDRLKQETKTRDEQYAALVDSKEAIARDLRDQLRSLKDKLDSEIKRREKAETQAKQAIDKVTEIESAAKKVESAEAAAVKAESDLAIGLQDAKAFQAERDTLREENVRLQTSIKNMEEESLAAISIREENESLKLQLKAARTTQKMERDRAELAVSGQVAAKEAQVAELKNQLDALKVVHQGLEKELNALRPKSPGAEGEAAAEEEKGEEGGAAGGDVKGKGPEKVEESSKDAQKQEKRPDEDAKSQPKGKKGKKKWEPLKF